LATRFGAGQPRRRLITTLVVMMLVLSAVLFKVGFLQSFGADSLRAAGEQQWTRDRALPAQRGSIFDRNGDELALSVPARTIAVNPYQVADAAGTAEVLARILDLDDDRQRELADVIAAQDRGFAYVARQVDIEVAEQVAALELAGVSIYREDRRMMPGGVTGRSVIGRTDIDGKGIAGLERQYDAILRGTSGAMRLEIAPGGRSIPGSDDVTTSPVPGEDLVLTLDRSVQHAAEQALLRRVGEIRARGGTVIVMDTNTGDVVAMASVRRAEEGGWEVTSGNFAAVDSYEPGSVAKVITIAAALNERSVTPGSMFTSNGYEWFYDRYLSDHAVGTMSVHDVLVRSSNIGTIRVSQSMGEDFTRKQWEYMHAFGLGEKTALGWPDESNGILERWQDWQGTENVTVAYGQGVSSTPIQLIAAINTIANRGAYVEPRLVDATVDAEGELTEMPPSKTRRVVRPRVARQVAAMMKDVVCRGTAQAAMVPGLSLAGKTGTGYKAFDNGTYLNDAGERAYYASFVGFLPAEDPQVTVLVSIDEPPVGSGDRFGGTAAAPVFAELAPTMMHELGVQPPAGSTGCEG
jgi:cell division protein FtsI (penicillin-binding protein 3)